MGKYQHASDALARLINQYQDLQSVWEAVAEFGSIDNLYDELTHRVAALTVQRDLLQKAVDAGEAAKAQVAAECELMRVDADAHCEQSILGSAAEVKRTIDKARADALAIVNDAKTKAQATLEAMDQKLAEQQAALADALDQHKAALAAGSAAQAQLDDLNTKIGAAQAQIAKILGS